MTFGWTLSRCGHVESRAWMGSRGRGRLTEVSAAQLRSGWVGVLGEGRGLPRGRDHCRRQLPFLQIHSKSNIFKNPVPNKTLFWRNLGPGPLDCHLWVGRKCFENGKHFNLLEERVLGSNGK